MPPNISGGIIKNNNITIVKKQVNVNEGRGGWEKNTKKGSKKLKTPQPQRTVKLRPHVKTHA